MKAFFKRHIFLSFLCGLIIIWLGGFALFIIDMMSFSPAVQETDGIVVLTGGAGRINTAVQLMKKNCDQKMLISGVGTDVTFTEIQKTLTLSIPETCRHHITLGHNATSTMGNAIETAAWAHYYQLHSLTLITSNYHMRRALLELHNLLENVTIYPYITNQTSFRNLFRLSSGRLLFIEYNKFIMAYVGLIHTTHSKKDLINRLP